MATRKLKVCDKGYNCGYGCISKRLKCKKNLSNNVTHLLDSLSSSLSKKQEPASKPSRYAPVIYDLAKQASEAVDNDDTFSTSLKYDSIASGRIMQGITEDLLTEAISDPFGAISATDVFFAESGNPFKAVPFYAYHMQKENPAMDYDEFESQITTPLSKAISAKTKQPTMDLLTNTVVTSKGKAVEAAGLAEFDAERTELWESAGDDGWEPPSAKVLADLNAREDAALGRKPTAKVDSAELDRLGRKWATAQGFEGDAGANGFDADVTRAHDVGHPVLHKLIGMDSKGIAKKFGEKDGLVVEEALVNGLEHLVYGDSYEGSIASSFRLAKVLLRASKGSFTRDDLDAKGMEIAELLGTAYTNPNYSVYANAMQNYVRKSGLVRASGLAFGFTATGG